jgi:hypothetical protein
MKLLIITTIDRYQQSASTPIFTKVVPSDTDLTEEFLNDVYSEMVSQVYGSDTCDDAPEPTFMTETGAPIQVSYVWGEESDCQIMLVPISQ